MSEMVERVAKAICLAANGGNVTWASLPEPVGAAGSFLGKDDYRDVARAAIAAMREPTATMTDAGDRVSDDGRSGKGAVVWQAMIDEALR